MKEFNPVAFEAGVDVWQKREDIYDLDLWAKDTLDKYGQRLTVRIMLTGETYSGELIGMNGLNLILFEDLYSNIERTIPATLDQAKSYAIMRAMVLFRTWTESMIEYMPAAFSAFRIGRKSTKKYMSDDRHAIISFAPYPTWESIPQDMQNILIDSWMQGKRYRKDRGD